MPQRKWCPPLGLVLVIALMLGHAGSDAGAQGLRIIPVPPHVKPAWTAVTGAPGVYYAPNLPTDIFRYQKKYYFYWEGYLYKSANLKGPWSRMDQAPDFFYLINPSYFKTAGTPQSGGAQPPAAPAPPAAPPAEPALPDPPQDPGPPGSGATSSN